MNDFETLYRQHVSALLRFAWGLSGDRSTAEDLVSETFVRILTRAPRLETRTALGYLLAVVRNTWLSGQRRRRREVALPDDIPAPHRNPASNIDDQDRLLTVLAALDGLKEGERAALLLRVDHELPYEDVAAALGISPGAAKVRVHRARLHLSRILDTKGEDHELRRDA